MINGEGFSKSRELDELRAGSSKDCRITLESSKMTEAVVCHPGSSAKLAKKPSSWPANALAEGNPIWTFKAPLCRVTGVASLAVASNFRKATVEPVTRC